MDEKNRKAEQNKKSRERTNAYISDLKRYIDILRERNEAANAKYEKAIKQNELANKQIEALTKEKERIEEEYHLVIHSKAYKVGLMLAYIPRKIRDFIKRILKKQ